MTNVSSIPDPKFFRGEYVRVKSDDETHFGQICGVLYANFCKSYVYDVETGPGKFLYIVSEHLISKANTLEGMIREIAVEAAPTRETSSVADKEPKVRFVLPVECGDGTGLSVVTDPKILANIVREWAEGVQRDQEAGARLYVGTKKMSDEEVDRLPEM